MVPVTSSPLWVVCHEHRHEYGDGNCTRDGGRPSGFGDQALIPSHRKLLRPKAVVVSVAETPGSIPAGTVERGERKRTAAEVSKAD